jgi:hypothetical protein
MCLYKGLLPGNIIFTIFVSARQAVSYFSTISFVQGFIDMSGLRNLFGAQTKRIAVICLRNWRDGNTQEDGTDRPITLEEVCKH